MAKKGKKSAVTTLSGSFGNVNIGESTASIRLTVSRANLDVLDADTLLCGRRLRGKLVVGLSGDLSGQQTLPGMPDPEIEGTFDVKGYGVSPKAIGFGLTFSLDRLDLKTLAGMAKRDGKLLIEGSEALPDYNGETPESGEA
jgi:hypothetical protein